MALFTTLHLHNVAGQHEDAYARWFDEPHAASPHWMEPRENSDEPLALSLRIGKTRLTWRPGRLLVEGRSTLPEQMLAAIAEFSFYEGELRKLEAALPPHEATAAADAKYAYEIHSADMPARAHFRKSMESLASLRLTFARLEPRFSIPARSLSSPARRLIERLSDRALIEDRLEAVSDRLEACEELYEGAVDRMTDHRWYRRGNLLEIAIVVLLAIEVLQLCGEMAVRLWGGHG